jgi:hypothetical protein
VERLEPYTVNEVVEQLAELDGKRVRVVGVLTLEHEGRALWHVPKAERRDGSPGRSSVWVELEGPLRDRTALGGFDGRRVIADATVDARHQGHLDGWCGVIRVSALTKV